MSRPWTGAIDAVLLCLEPGCEGARGHDGALWGRTLHRRWEGGEVVYWRGAGRARAGGAVAGQDGAPRVADAVLGRS